MLKRNSPCPVCGRYNNRPVSIDALIRHNNKILLIKRGIEPYKGYWGLPGGHVNWDETVGDAVVREVKEETALTVTKLVLFGVYSSPNRHPNQAIAISYMCETRGAPKSGDDAVDLNYYSLDNVPTLLAFDHDKIIADYIRKKKKSEVK